MQVSGLAARFMSSSTVTDSDKWQKTPYCFVDGHGLSREFPPTCAPSLHGFELENNGRSLSMERNGILPPNDPLSIPVSPQRTTVSPASSFHTVVQCILLGPVYLHEGLKSPNLGFKRRM